MVFVSHEEKQIQTTVRYHYTEWVILEWLKLKTDVLENQDGSVGRHTAPPRTTRTDRESNGKGVRRQGNKKKHSS